MSLALLATDSLCDPQIMCGYLRITAERRTACTGVVVVACYRALFHKNVDIKITFTKLLNRLLTSIPTAWSISGEWARVLHVARSAVAMTAHSVTNCVVVPSIRFTRYFTLQNGTDQEDHLASFLTYMHADNISLPNELWVNRYCLELLLMLKDSSIIGLMNQALILHKNVCKNVLQFCVNTSCG